MDGNFPIQQMFDLEDLPARNFTTVWIHKHLSLPIVCHPWTLDFGIPAEMTGIQYLRMALELGNDVNLWNIPSGTVIL